MRRSSMLVGLFGACLPLALSPGSANADEFWVDVEGYYIVGEMDYSINADGGERVDVLSAWLYHNERLWPIPIGDPNEPFLIDQEAAEAVGGWAWFDVRVLEEDRLVIVGHPVPIANNGTTPGGDPDGKPNGGKNGDGLGTVPNTNGAGPFDEFFAELNPSLESWYGFAFTFEEVIGEMFIAKAQSINNFGEEMPVCPSTVGQEGPTDDDQTFTIPLSPGMILVIVIRDDGTVEMYVYSKDIDGCWEYSLLPDGWIPPPDGTVINIPTQTDGDGVIILPPSTVPDPP